MPTDIPKTIAAVLCKPRIAARSVMIRLMPAPMTVAPMLPKMYAKMFAGRFTLASSLRSSSSSVNSFSIYCVRISCAIKF